MAKVRVAAFGISLDGYGAGPDQSLENPLGAGFMNVMDWFFPTKIFREKVIHQQGGETGVDNAIAEKSFENVGAWVMGRNMFSPGRGAWDMKWRGWWGANPPYHVPVFVLTHHARTPTEMKGGTEFRFVTDGIHSALKQAREAAGDRDIRIGGGASTIRQYLKAGLIDEMHLAISPVLLGSGEHLFAGLDLPALGYTCSKHVPSPAATHVVITKTN